MAEASKMEQMKEEKQKMNIVKKRGNLGEKLDEVTKRDERDKSGSWKEACGKRWEGKIQNNLENREIFQVSRATGFSDFDLNE